MVLASNYFNSNASMDKLFKGGIVKLFFLLIIFDFCLCQSKWIKTFGADEIDGANHVLILEDGFLITGFTSSFGNGGSDLWIIRTDKERIKIWDKFYGGMHSETGYKSIRTKDGGFIILGQTFSYGSGSGDIWVLKISDNGIVLWDKTIMGICLWALLILKKLIALMRML